MSNTGLHVHPTSKSQDHQSVWSLYQLLQFNARLFMSVVMELDEMVLFHLTHPYDEGEEKKLEADASRILGVLAQECRLANLTPCHDQIRRIERQIGSVRLQDLYALMTTLRGHIQEELEARKFFLIDPGEQRYYDGSFIEPIIKERFPSAIPDLVEAGKCLVFRRPTATVSHCMRALEVGLDSLAKTLNVIIKNPSWETVLNDCQTAIGNLPKEDRHFYTACATEFRNFQHAWRNYVMHFQKDKPEYELGEALGILQSVGRFFARIAPRLSESP